MNQNQNTQDTSKVAASTRSFIPLEAIRVASPCKADWNKMSGDAQARFCGSCEKHVYNLSSMTREEAENLVAKKEGKLCVRFYQREDGTMLTSDCRVGVAALSMGLREAKFSPLRVLAIAACAIGAILPNAMRANAAGLVDSMRRAPVVGKVVSFVSPQATAGAPMLMGEVVPTRKTKATPKPKPVVMGKPIAPTRTMGIIAPRKAMPKCTPHKTTKHVAPKAKVQRRTNARTLTRRK